MKNKVLFLSTYPLTPEEIRDGFYQRVLNIDSFFKEDKRTYLSVSLFKNFNKDILVIDSNLTFVKCNFFFHFFYIVKLFNNASLVYIQSLFNTLYPFLFIKFIKNFYVLDLHGVVPEELELNGKKIHKSIFSFIEKFIFNKLDIVISVTKKLENHYKKKYPTAKATYIIYSIIPDNLEIYEGNLDDSDTVNIIYSGNIQKWQNIELMLQTIKNVQPANFRYQILTGNLTGMNELIKKYDLDSSDLINIKTVSPDELNKYYTEAHYGFILRDDIVVNNVACPTKLIEYMNYGITPIVLSDNIGDFKELGYEYIKVENFNMELRPKKSKINIELIEKLKKYNKINLRTNIFKFLYK